MLQIALYAGIDTQIMYGPMSLSPAHITKGQSCVWLKLFIYHDVCYTHILTWMHAGCQDLEEKQSDHIYTKTAA